ncbi:peptidoglycan-binding domain-containing protein [Streptomyces huasconensis]|uniref:peptidoglycan-binding domain-containing protein n=1 Tax=Streptomyces huasconensis TaxID=1854574 RepID=UPI0034043DCB
MITRKRLALATATVALGGGLALGPAAGAFATAPQAAPARAAAEYNCANELYSGTAITKAGSPKKQVAEVQCLLKLFHGYSSLKADGLYGNKTHKAVYSFQKKKFPNKPSEWDGIVGKKTWAKLRAW